MYWLYVSIIPFIIGVIGLLWIDKENRSFALLINGGVCAGLGIICLLIFGFGPELKSLDTEIWNGRITHKYSQKVSCSHSYECNCYYTTDSKGNTEKHCSTCYEHSYDVDWIATTSNGERIDFDRVDRQGLREPSRYSKAYVNETTAIEHTFKNYFRVSTQNIINNFEDGLPNVSLPPYPSQYDLYRVRKVLPIDFGLTNYDDWEWLVDDLNANLGAKKQVNIIFIITTQPSPNYEWNVSKAWLGGKKNDVIVIIDSQNGKDIDWVRVVTWSTNPRVKIKIRDDVQNIGKLDRRDDIVKAVGEDIMTGFQRIHMKDQEFLLKSWQPEKSTTVILIALACIAQIIGLCVSKNNV